MSFINALQSGNYQFQNNSNSNVTIKTGNGSNNINVNAGSANISTGNGNQTINAIAADQLVINTGATGSDYVNANAMSAIINTNDSNDTIKFTGTNFNISAIGGDNTIVVNGGANSTNKNSIAVGNGNDTIIAKGNNIGVKDSAGDLTAFLYSNNLNIDAGNGSHNVGFWGNNVDMKFGNGNNNIQTLDYTIAGANANTTAALNSVGIVDALANQTKLSSVVTARNVLANSSFDAADTIAKQYNLSTTEAASLKQLYTSGQINQTYADGTPKYVLMASPDLTKQNNGTPVYVIGVRDGATHTWSLNSYKGTNDGYANLPANYQATSNYSGAGKECIALDGGTNWVTGTVAGQNGTTYQDTVTSTYLLNGVNDVSIKSGNGSNNIFLTGDATGKSNLAIDLGDGNNNIGIRNGYYTSTVDQQIHTDMTNATGSVFIGSKTHTSPLILDTNGDGVVSAKAGEGVDVDGNGIADGAATAGDKMLAMSDFSGNGAIDGQEVFGNETVSPFTHEKLNAANGFEALKTIAEQAKKYTGIDCMKDGNVDLQSLKQALSTVGVNLGFVSDENNKNVEDLGNVATINVNNYTTDNTEADIEHRQQGSFTTTDGAAHKVDDVWFTAR